MCGTSRAPAVPMPVCCCVSKITTALEAARSSRRRCSRTLRGSDLLADGELTRQSERSAVYERALEDLARARTDVCVRVLPRRHRWRPRIPERAATRSCPKRLVRGIRVRLDPAVERFEDLRLGPQEQRPSEQCGDLLVRDRHGNWTYQFAVVVDDWLQGVNLVIRGEDLLDSTGRQIQLARLLGRAQPPAFLHHQLLMKTADAEAQQIGRRHRSA